MSRWTRFTYAEPGHSLLSADVWFQLGAILELSPRELQIVQGVFDDQKEETIAAELGISPHTVNTHLQRLYRKLRVCSRARLIMRVMAEYFAFTAISNRADRTTLDSQLMSCAQATDEHVTCRSVNGRPY
jgi:DNA-binding CsgD family transcriptional regulator